MIFLIVLLPLIGAALNGLLFSSGLIKKDHESERRIVSIIGCTSILLAALISTYLFIQLIQNDDVVIEEARSRISILSSGELDWLERVLKISQRLQQICLNSEKLLPGRDAKAGDIAEAARRFEELHRAYPASRPFGAMLQGVSLNSDY